MRLNTYCVLAHHSASQHTQNKCPSSNRRRVFGIPRVRWAHAVAFPARRQALRAWRHDDDAAASTHGARAHRLTRTLACAHAANLTFGQRLWQFYFTISLTACRSVATVARCQQDSRFDVEPSSHMVDIMCARYAHSPLKLTPCLMCFPCDLTTMLWLLCLRSRRSRSFLECTVVHARSACAAAHE